MTLLGTFGLDADAIILLAAGMGAGAALLAALQSALEGDDGRASLARRVSHIELRLAAGKDAQRLSRTMFQLVARMPLIADTRTTAVFAAAHQLSRDAAPADPDALAKEFAEAMQENMNAAVEIARAIIDPAMNLNEAKDRREAAARIRKAAGGLSTAFWDRHGALVLASPMPPALKELLKTFFACVKTLVSAVSALAREPGFAELDALLDCVIDVLDAAKAIVDELERMTGAA